MQVQIKKITNRPIDSNCFILYKENSTSCVIIDPGTEDCKEVLGFLLENKLVPEYIILTHEHFDHVWGVNLLKKNFNCCLICSPKCSERIVRKKGNMSVFYDQVGFDCCPADQLIDFTNPTFIWNDLKLEFLNTPGHTDSSISLLVENNLFIGDLAIMGHKTVTKLPSGNKSMLKNSFDMLVNTFSQSDIYVFPGHGDGFFLNEINIAEFI